MMMKPRAQSTEPRKSSLRVRLIVIFLLTVLLLGLAIGIGSVVVAFQSGQQQIYEQLDAIATLKKSVIESWLKTLMLDLRVELYRGQAQVYLQSLLEDPPDTTTFREAYNAQAKRFEETVALRPMFQELLLLNREGVVIVASHSDREGEVWDWVSYFQQGLDAPGIYVQTLSYSGVTADLNTVVVVHPVLNDRWETVGVLIGRASLDPLNAIMLERTGMGDTGETYLVGSNRVLLTPSRFPGHQAGQKRISTDLVDTALVKKGQGAMRYEDYRGKSVVAVHHWLPELEVVLVAKRDRDEAFRPIYTTIRLNLILTLLAMAIVGVLGWFVARDLLLPIGALASTARKITRGDLLQIADITRRDEIGELAEAFNRMTQRLREMLQREAARAAELQQEITRREQVEQSLRASEERYRLVSELTSDFAASIRVDEQGILVQEWMTAAITTITGYTFEELRTMQGLRAIVHHDDVAKFQQDMQTLLQGEPYISEYRIMTKQGDIRWLRDYGHPVWDDDLGRVVHMYRAAQDITARKHVEEEREQLLVQLQEQARQVQQIIDTVPEGVLLLDAAGQIMRANPLAQQDLAMLADAKIGDTLQQLGNRPLEAFLTSPPKGLWHELATEGRNFQILARPIELAAISEGWVMVIRDVTEYRELERHVQQQERLAAVGQLAAGIAHDFNNIMAAIVLYAQMMLRTSHLSNHDQERLRIINQQAQNAADLIQQILDFSRRAVLERHPLGLLPLLKEQVKLLRRTLPENIQISLIAMPGDYTINADPTRIQQMLLNLAVNARDAMPNGGMLEIKLACLSVPTTSEAPLPDMKAGDWIQLTIKDTGTGIPPDVLPHIFQPFFTTKEPGQGTGLGLAQVHGIVGVHQGHITVSTAVGEGTTFIIYLPALTIEHNAQASYTEAQELPQGSGQHILVVEDDVTVRSAIVESLNLLNYQTLEAVNGREALAVVASLEGELALILSDVVMPGMGGVALFHALRKQGITLPFILISGHPLESTVEDMEGLTGWLTKPPNLEQLATTMARTLQGVVQKR